MYFPLHVQTLSRGRHLSSTLSLYQSQPLPLPALTYHCLLLSLSQTQLLQLLLLSPITMSITFNLLPLLIPYFATLICPLYALNTDGVALLSFMSHWTFVPPAIESSWKASDSTPCSWVGVECGRNHSLVTALNLSSYQIWGQLGPELAQIRHLRSIVLYNNSFNGSIPSQLANCSRLEYLDLSANSFSGTIPESFGKLQRLQYVNLFSNTLSGRIPESLFNIPKLKLVYLNLNSLNGSIPSNIGNATELAYLWLFGNRLSGTIPSSIGNCIKLEELYLNDNKLVGVMPESLSNLENIVYLDVSENSLEGSIPSGLGNCKKLNTLVLSFNNFNSGIPTSIGNCSSLLTFSAVSCGLTGLIPSSLGQLTGLTILYLSSNNLSGTIPPELGNCKFLNDLEMYENQLEGEIPKELGKLSELTNLFLYSNNLTGEIPMSIWKIQSLENLIVYNNRLSGEIPPEITELKNLKNISVFNNQFSGVIPKNLGLKCNLTLIEFTNNSFVGKLPPNLCFGKQLRILNLGLNHFEGSIPSDVGTCPTLTRLILKQNNFSGVIPEFEKNSNLLFMDLSNNKLAGTIPLSFGDLVKITSLNLSRNRLTGTLPSELGNLHDLQSFSLSQNSLEGSLPYELANCTRLLILDMAHNSLNGTVPYSFRNLSRLATLDISGNHFTGEFPPFFFEFEFLSDLQVGRNFFSGTIPSSIGANAAAQSLKVLNLSKNGFSGYVPSGIRNLVMLEQFDVSDNNMTGTLADIGQLHSLIELNVSHNLFSGPIPETLMKFFTTNPSSFIENPGLCTSCLNCVPYSGLKACTSESNNSKGLSRLSIAVMALGASLLSFVLVLVLGFVIIHYRKTQQEVEIFAQEGASTWLITKIMEATDNLNERYIIGKGAHGTVYKASVPGKVYAVKKLVFDGVKGGSKSMVQEIQTIGKVKHRNLIKLEGFWFRESEDYGLIIYEYMENGSLHDVLHEVKPVLVMDWNIRYQIALGTAQGLTYLHDDCDPAIVHRDIKPMNILLDSEMEPHISDFGIAKLLDKSSASAPSSTIPGTIGYIAPENAFTTTKSKESDVYSYGVVLLELLTRKKALGSFPDELDIVQWSRSVWNSSEEIEMIVDRSLSDEFLGLSVREEVVDVLLVALRCTEMDPSKRPTMRDVVKQLVDADIKIRSKLPSCEYS